MRKTGVEGTKDGFGSTCPASRDWIPLVVVFAILF